MEGRREAKGGEGGGAQVESFADKLHIAMGGSVVADLNYLGFFVLVFTGMAGQYLFFSL